jgi:hypothetical protein
MATLKVFFSKAPTTGYVFQSGRAIHFVDHKYATNSPAEIAELEKECSYLESNYFIDETKLEIDSSELDPIAVIKAKARAEARAEVAAATTITRDMGATDQTAKLSGIANSNDLGGANVASGTSQPVASASAIKVASTVSAVATKL